jgi:hypothetical protein
VRLVLEQRARGHEVIGLLRPAVASMMAGLNIEMLTAQNERRL